MLIEHVAAGFVPNLQLLLAAIGCVLFEERIGCFNDPPPVKAREFIDNIVGVFKYQQPLMYKPPIYKLFPTKDWRVFEGYADRVTHCARQFVNKVYKVTWLSPGISFYSYSTPRSSNGNNDKNIRK